MCEIDGESGDPVRYGDGSIIMSESDLVGGAYLIPWSHSRSYGNQVSLGSRAWNGNNWLTPQNEWLSFSGASEIVLIKGMKNSLWFDLVGSTWVVRFGAHVTLTQNTGDKTYLLFNQNTGESRVYFDNDSSWPAQQQGALKSITLAGGAASTLSYDASTGNLLSYDFVQDSRSQRYVYAYGANGLLS